MTRHIPDKNRHGAGINKHNTFTKLTIYRYMHKAIILQAQTAFYSYETCMVLTQDSHSTDTNRRIQYRHIIDTNQAQYRHIPGKIQAQYRLTAENNNTGEVAHRFSPHPKPIHGSHRPPLPFISAIKNIPSYIDLRKQRQTHRNANGSQTHQGFSYIFFLSATSECYLSSIQ